MQIWIKNDQIVEILRGPHNHPIETDPGSQQVEIAAQTDVTPINNIEMNNSDKSSTLRSGYIDDSTDKDLSDDNNNSCMASGDQTRISTEKTCYVLRTRKVMANPIIARRKTVITGRLASQPIGRMTRRTIATKG